MSKGLPERIEQELSSREKATGLTMADLLTLPDVQRQLAQRMLCEGKVRLSDMRAQADEATMRTALQALIEGGFVCESDGDGEPFYSLRIGSRRQRNVPQNVWTALHDKLKE